MAIKGKTKKFIFDNEFNSNNVKSFLDAEGIDFHIAKPNSHTGNSDVERLNNTITEKIRALNLEEQLPIEIQIIKAINIYNNSYHSTIECTPFDVVNNKIYFEIIKERMEKYKDKLNEKRNLKMEKL